MQVQHHVNQLPPGYWPRTKAVALYEGRLICVLDYSRAYRLVDAYRYAPHARFLNLRTDLDLARFVRTYGPLCLPSLPCGEEPTEPWWSLQRRLKAMVKLLQAFSGSGAASDSLRRALLEHLRMNLDEWKRHPNLSHWSILRGKFSATGEPEEWVSQAALWSIREAASFCIYQSFRTDVTVRATWEKRRAEIYAGPRVDSLQDAFNWMVWEDEHRQRALLFCQECGAAFQPPTRHARKFCTHECAHRAAAREWRRRDLRQKRKRS